MGWGGGGGETPEIRSFIPFKDTSSIEKFADHYVSHISYKILKTICMAYINAIGLRDSRSSK